MNVNTPAAAILQKAKQNMLVKQLREQFMLDEQILQLMAEIPREFFVPDIYKRLAYAEMQIPLGHGQIMMSPNEEARMLDALAIKPQDTVLEIGTGTGYVTALLAKVAHKIYSVDIFADFTQSAQQKLSTLKLGNVEYFTRDAATGFSENAPYDIICITAAMPLLPKMYLQNLQTGGRLFAILGAAPAMTATLITRTGIDAWEQQSLFETCLPEMLHAPKPELFKF